jgi:LysR family transcriptional regulator, hydrogen peroxide-inducible genes activator
MKVTIEFDQLRYFLRVAELKSFTRAATELFVSQPALSRSIQRLEETLGMPLLVRKARSLELTDAGSLLQSRARQIIAILEDTQAEISDDGQSGRLRIGAIPTVAPYFLPEVLGSFSSQYPLATFVVHEETTDRLVKGCSQGEVDIGILAGPLEAKYLEQEVLFEEELWLVLPCQHPLAAARRVTLDCVEDQPFIMLDEAHCLANNILGFCQRQSFQPKVIGRTNQLSMVQELVALSHGISLIPNMAKRVDHSERRVYRSFSGQKPTRQLVMIWDPYRFQTRMQQNFRDHLRKFAGRKPN